MSHQITKHPDLVKKENQVKDLQKQLKKKKSTLKSLKTRLQNMQRDIEEISRKVQSQMMGHMEKLDELRQEIAELARKLKKSKGISKDDKAALEGMAEDLSGDDLFGEGYESYKEHKERLETGDFDFDEEQRAKMRDMFQQFQVKPPEEEQRSIRKVFLKLSQKFHPDRAKNKKEEAQFHEMMQDINQAYQQNDIHTLLEMERLYLTEELDFSSQSITIDVLDQAINRLEKELKFLNNQISRTSSEIKNIRKSDMGNMLTVVNKAEKEGEGFEAMNEHNEQAITVLTQLRDGLKHSIEIDAVSPKLMEMMMGQMMGGIDDDIDLEDIMSLMNMMGGDDDDDFGFPGFYDDEYEEIENPKFPIGSSVRIKANKGHELHRKTKMKGWEGRVAQAYYDEKERPTYQVNFDSVTIHQMPNILIEASIDDMEAFDEQEFLEKELEASSPRDKETDAYGAYRKRFHHLNWSFLPKKQGERIQNILLQQPNASDEDNWTAYLNKQLTFPFEATTRGLYSMYGIPKGNVCKVFKIDLFQEDSGHIMLIQPKGSKQKLQHPLTDLAPVKASKKVNEICDDYLTWAEDALLEADW